MNGLVARLRNDAEKGNLLAREVTLPLAQGIAAFAEGSYREATRMLEPLYLQLTRIGGSHVQREVFEDTLLEAYLRAEQFDKGEAMLHARLKQRASIRDTFWLGRAQAGEGQAEAARASLNRALKGWQQADPGTPELAGLQHLATRVG
jgi:tetratricopeptide (TPR) repeat protein